MPRQFCRDAVAVVLRIPPLTFTFIPTPKMDFYTAMRTADNHYRRYPLTVSEGQENPEAYRLAYSENLAMAVYDRAKAIMEETTMDHDEANIAAASEVAELAKGLPLPTPAHLADTAKQIEEAAAAAAEQDAEDAAVALA